MGTKKEKKADLSLNFMVMAAISLIVLIVMIALFTGKASIFNRNTGSTCSAQGGVCSDYSGDKGKCDIDGYPIKVLAKPCTNYVNGQQEEGIGQCCIPLFDN